MADGITVGDFLRNFNQNVPIDDIVDHVANDFNALDDWDTASNQRCQVTRKTRQVNFLKNIPHNRQSNFERVPLVPPGNSFNVILNPDDQTANHNNDQPPKMINEIRGSNQNF